jgi:hypothetical protein
VNEAAAAGATPCAATQFAAIATSLQRDAPVIDIPLYTLAGFAGARHAPDRATDAIVFNATPAVGKRCVPGRHCVRRCQTATLRSRRSASRAGHMRTSDDGRR